MKKNLIKSIKVFAIFFVVGFFVFAFNTDKAEAFACASNTTGSVNWNSAATWTSCNGGYPGQSGNTDTVTIANAAVAISANTSVTVASITFTGGASATSVTVAGGVTLTVTGAVTISAPTASVTKELAAATGNLSIGGLVTLASGSASTRISKISVTTGTLTMSAGLTCTGSAETFTVASGGTLNFTGTMSSGCLTVTINAASTTNFSGTVALNGAYTFGIVEIDSGTTTLGAGTMTFAGTTLVRDSATLRLGAFAFTQTGNLTVGEGTSGNVSCPSAASCTGLKTFTGNITVNAGGVFDFTTSSTNATLSFGGTSYSHSGSTFNTGTGTITITGTGAMAFAGSSNMTFGSSSAGVMTIPTNRALSNDKTSGSLTIGALTISSPTAANSFALASGSTTNITGNLTFSANVTANNQTITLKGTADLNVGGNLVMTGAPTTTGVSQIVCDATGTTARVDVTGTTGISSSGTAGATGENIVDLSLCTNPTFTSGGLITITGNTTGTSSNPELKVGSNGTITASAGITNATGTNGRFSTGSGTIVNLTGALTVANQAFFTNTNANTELKTTGTASIASAITWPGSLNVVSGTTTLGAVAITISGTTTVSGALTYTSNAAAKTFTGLVTINSGGSVDFNSLATDPAINLAAGVTANSGAGSINFGTGATALTATQEFTASSNMTFGAVTVNSGVTLTNSVSTTLTLGSLTLASGAGGVTLPTGSTTSVTGAVAFTANATATDTAITMSGTAALSVGGALTFNTPSSTGTQTLDVGTGTLTVTGLTTLNGGASATSTVTASTGTLNLNGGVTVGGTASNGRIITTDASTVNFTGTWAGAGTFTFDSTTTFNTSGTTALNATITLPNLNVLSGTTSLGAVAIGISGPTNVTGALSYASGSQTKTFTGLVTINSGGSVDFNSLATDPATSFASGITADSGAGSINWGTGTATFSATQAFTGSTNMTFGGAFTVSSGTLSNNSTGTLTVGGTITLTGNLTQGSGSILSYTSTNAFSGAGTLDASTNANTVNYSGGAQTVKATTYRTLILSGSGGKTFPAGTTTVNTLLSIENGTNANTFTGSLAYGSSAALQYNAGASARTVSSEWPSPFTASGGVTVGGSGAISLNASKQMGSNTNVPLTISNGATLTPGTNTITLHGDYINNGGTITTAATPWVFAGTVSTQAIDGFTTTGLVSMTKTSGTATLQSAVSGAGLTINGSGGTLNLGSGLTHTFSGDVTLTAGTLNGGSSTLNLSNTSATVWNGTGTLFTPNASTVNFSGGDQTLAASSMVFNNLTFSGTGTKTLGGSLTVNGNWDVQGGGGATYATWNPADKSTHITLSNGNLTATNDGASNNQVRATIGKSSGKWYWELDFTRTGDTQYAYFVPFGLSKTTESVETYSGATADGMCISTDGEKWTNGTNTAYTTAWTDGDVIGVALDMDAGSVTLYRNGNSLGVLYSGLSGTYYPATGSSFGTGYTTANFGATAFTYNPPNGYNAGVYTGGASVAVATGNNSITLKGDFTNTGTALDAGSSNIIFDGTASSQAIAPFLTTGIVSMTKTSGTATLSGAITAGGALTVNGAGGTLNLGTGLAHTFTGATTLTAGTLNLGTSSLTTASFSSSNANTRALTLGSNTINLTGTGTVWDMSTSTNSTINAGSYTIKLTDSSASAKTFAGGGKTYNNFWFAPGAGSGSLTISGDNTFNDFKDDGTVAHSILFTTGSTQHLSTWSVLGNSGQLISIDSTTTGTHSLVKDTFGSITTDYLDVQHSIATPNGVWFAGSNSVNHQNVASAGSGWFFFVENVYRGGGSGGGGGEAQNGGGDNQGGGGQGGGSGGGGEGGNGGGDNQGGGGQGGGGGDSGFLFLRGRMFASAFNPSFLNYFSKILNF